MTAVPSCGDYRYDSGPPDFLAEAARAIAARHPGLQPERQFVQEFLTGSTYTSYDRLIQLCDALALPSGFCLVEKRLMDVALRRGLNDHTLAKWRAYLGLRREFDEAIGTSIYRVLPGVVENTFGWAVALP